MKGKSVMAKMKTTNKRTFDGESWQDEYYEQESFDASGMLQVPTDMSMPDNPLFTSLLNKLFGTCGGMGYFYTTPEVNSTTLQIGIRSFGWDQWEHRFQAPMLVLNCIETGQQSLQTHHVPTQWKMPTFIDGEFNNFTFLEIQKSCPQNTGIE